MPELDLDSAFSALLFGNVSSPPFPWQRDLFAQFRAGLFPPALTLPTGSGKTSLMAVWLLALAENPQAVPRRLVWVVNRRVVVDQATEDAIKLRDHLQQLPEWNARLKALTAGEHQQTLAISTLRGEFADNREWSDDASRPAIIIGTVDMVGSRLLFSGYGDSYRRRPKHAGLLGHDTLIVNDEAHLTPAFAELLLSMERRIHASNPLRPFRTIRVSATQSGAEPYPASLDADLAASPVFAARWNAVKRLQLHESPSEKHALSRMVDLAVQQPVGRTIVFVRAPRNAQEIAALIRKKTASNRVAVLTGTLRGLERDKLAKDILDGLGFLAPEAPAEPSWLVSTSAGEVGINISSERMVTDLDSAEHLLQRFGRLNRFGESQGVAHLVYALGKKTPPPHQETIKFLRSLPQLEGSIDISPRSLFENPAPEEACEPKPPMAVLHDWILDLWCQTSLPKMEQRPDVEPWLHGKQDNYPETEIAWRTEVADLTADAVTGEDRAEYLEHCPVLAHERLRWPTYQLREFLSTLVSGDGPHPSAILVRADGSAECVSLAKPDQLALAYSLLLLSPSVAGIRDGLLQQEPSAPDSYDVAHLGPKGTRWSAAEDEKFTQLACEIALSSPEFDEQPRTLQIWVQPRLSKPEQQHLQLWKDHTDEVERLAQALGEKLALPEDILAALTDAARRHDLGKKAELWQRFAGNTNGDPPLAKPKPNHRPNPKLLAGFRHEFQSLRESAGASDLAQHLVASHHGWARPHFPVRAFDRKALSESRALSLTAARRFAHLSERYGHWGLAYLESVFRTADALASRAFEENDNA